MGLFKMAHDKRVSQFVHEHKLTAVFFFRFKYVGRKKDLLGEQPSRIQRAGNKLNI